MQNNRTIRIMVWKELRENVPLAVVGLLAGLFVVSQGMLDVFSWSSTYQYTIPFVYYDGTLSRLSFVSAMLGMALGFRQSVWESHTGTYLFLLHRPLQRWSIIAVKVVVGLLLYAGTMAIPLLVYSVWAATSGTHASPFFWSMTLTGWKSLAFTTLFYFGAFLSGISSGRWYGSRLLPLAALAGAVGVLSHGMRFWPWLCAAGLTLIGVLAWLAIMRTSTIREYA